MSVSGLSFFHDQILRIEIYNRQHVNGLILIMNSSSLISYKTTNLNHVRIINNKLTKDTIVFITDSHSFIQISRIDKIVILIK